MKLEKIKHSYAKIKSDRVYHIDFNDILVLLERLPENAYKRLKAVHFNDQSQGAKRLGYLNYSRKEITMCALPPRISLTRFLKEGESPRIYGARRGSQWPQLAIRRFLLYDTFLRELGHLQIILPQAKSMRRKFAAALKSDEFARKWRSYLWSKHFAHKDLAHFPPTAGELEKLKA
jgi:hypothetical protein